VADHASTASDGALNDYSAPRYPITRSDFRHTQADVDAEDVLELAAPEDEEPVETLAACGSCQALT
jgi:hypothetical protein